MTDEKRNPPAEHYISTADFDPYSVEKLTADQEKYFFASRRQLMWWKLKRHKVAVVCGFILMILYASTLISEFISPYNLHSRDTSHIYCPAPGRASVRPRAMGRPVCVWLRLPAQPRGISSANTPSDPNKVHKLRFFCSGDQYSFWGQVDKGSSHLFCVEPKAARSSFWEPTGLAAIYSHASCMARGFRSLIGLYRHHR